jgi:hypothetical protein
MFLNSPNPTIISHSTVAFNQATGVGNGLHLQSSVVEMNHSILASNTGAVLGDATVVAGANLNSKFSLIGRWQGSGVSPTSAHTPDANGNLVGSGANGIEPRLSPLADNGGPTKAHALLPTSPAINAGDPTAAAGQGGVPTHDQRGAPFTRVFGGRIDIGATERIPILLLPGDYARDGVVDAADYTAWRDSLGTMPSPGTGADGNGDGVVDERDYTVWKSNFGAAVIWRGSGSNQELAVASVVANPDPESRDFVEPRFAEPAPQRPALPGIRGGIANSERPILRAPRDRVLETWLTQQRLGTERAEPVALATHANGRDAAAIDVAFDQLLAASKCLRPGQWLRAAGIS